MHDDEIQYLLSKQLPSVYSLNTNYGDVLLDDELRLAVINALTPILLNRITGLSNA